MSRYEPDHFTTSCADCGWEDETTTERDVVFVARRHVAENPRTRGRCDGKRGR